MKKFFNFFLVIFLLLKIFYGGSSSSASEKDGNGEHQTSFKGFHLQQYKKDINIELKAQKVKIKNKTEFHFQQVIFSRQMKKKGRSGKKLILNCARGIFWRHRDLLKLSELTGNLPRQGKIFSPSALYRIKEDTLSFEQGIKMVSSKGVIKADKAFIYLGKGIGENGVGLKK